MAEKATTKGNGREKGRLVQATVPVEVYETLNDYRFANRVDKFSEVVTRALVEFAENHPVQA